MKMYVRFPRILPPICFLVYAWEFNLNLQLFSQKDKCCMTKHAIWEVQRIQGLIQDLVKVGARQSEEEMVCWLFGNGDQVGQDP